MSEVAPDIQIPPELASDLLMKVEDWTPELRHWLPDLPEDLKTSLNNSALITSTGTGGYPVSEDEIELAFNPNFPGDKEEQMLNFKGSFFHESYHVVQGFVGEENKYKGTSFINHAILEGAATKFEVARVGTNPGWAQYTEGEIEDWFREVLAMEYTSDGKTWGNIKFHDQETGRDWVLYRVGCYVIDEALKASGLEIEDLATMEPEQILKLSRLTELT